MQAVATGLPVRSPATPILTPLALALTEKDFVGGKRAHTSYVRPGKLFTAHVDLMEQIVGKVKVDFLERAREAVIQVLRGKS